MYCQRIMSYLCMLVRHSDVLTAAWHMCRAMQSLDAPPVQSSIVIALALEYPVTTPRFAACVLLALTSGGYWHIHAYILAAWVAAQRQHMSVSCDTLECLCRYVTRCKSSWRCVSLCTTGPGRGGALNCWRSFVVAFLRQIRFFLEFSYQICM